MKKIGLLVLKVVGAGLAAILLGSLWWRLWMNHGWPGSPHVLPRLLGEDGEGVYQAVMDEMILICGVVISALLITHHFMFRTKKQ